MQEKLSGTIIRVGVVESDDEKFVARYSILGNTTQLEGGYLVRLLLDLKYALNFSIQAIPGREFITEKNGTVGGMGEKLLTGQVDLVIASSYMLKYRVQYLGTTLSVGTDKIMIWFRPPRTSFEALGHGFVKPFSPEAWFGILVLLCIIIASTLLLSRIERTFRLRKHLRNYFWVIAAICQRGGTPFPSGFPTRLLYFHTFLSLGLIYTIYSASILSQLTATFNPFTTVAKLLDVKFYMLSNPLTSFSLYFENSVTYEGLKGRYLSRVDSTAKVFSGGYGYITSKDAIGYAARRLDYTDRDICETISSVPFYNVALYLTFYTRKGYPYKELINRKLLNALEVGLQRRYKDEFIKNTFPVCFSISKATVQSISISEVYVAFLIPFLIYVSSVAMLIIEIYWRSRNAAPVLRYID